MARRKTGKPRELEEEERPKDEPTLQEFIQQVHGTSPVGESSGMPSLVELKALFQTKSACIRYLASNRCPGGPFPTKDIAKHLGLRYQMVRNVITNPLKRGPNENWVPPTKPE